MSLGIYGIVKPSDVSVNDVEIIYHYSANRLFTTDVELTRLNSVDVLTPVFHTSDTSDDPLSENNEILGGLYNLKLSSENFSRKGFHNLYFRPKQIRTIITDCGVLASLPSVRGIVLDLSNVTDEDRSRFVDPRYLIGHRIEYLNNDNTKIPNFFRIVTSAFFCEPVVTNQNNTLQKSIRYKYTEQTTNLVFLTLTPSSISTTTPNVVPFIGAINQKIIISNTFFNPFVVEIQTVEHDIETLAHALFGNHSKSMENGIYTIYDDDGNIFRQYNIYEIKNEFNETLFEVRERRDNIDNSLTLENIKN